MTRTELIERISTSLSYRGGNDEVELAIKEILGLMSSTLQNGNRIEIRDFGTFSLTYRAPRIGRNPKTGERVPVGSKYVPHFKPGKGLRMRVNTLRAKAAVDE